MVNVYPLSENSQAIVSSKEVLKIIMNPQEKSPEFKDLLFKMCKDNLKLSKKMAKVHIKAIN